MSAQTERPEPPAPEAPGFREALWFWLKLGFISFGGPAGQIAIMHRELVERRRWVSEDRFLHALNYCMLLPGPEAQQLATYLGWLLHRTWGGIAAGTLFVLPAALILFGLSWAYVSLGQVPWVAGLFYGLKPAVLAIVIAALIRIGQRVLHRPAMWLVAAAAFVSLFLLKLPFPLVIASAGALGLLGGRFWPEYFRLDGNAQPGSPSVLDNQLDPLTRPELVRRALRVLACCLTLWWAPVVGVAAWLGLDHVVFREAIFFSKAAMVTFGGAYAVLPYVSQQAVEAHGWLSAAQMLDGLGLAETTPGPLIMVLQFVGFLGAWNHPGQLSPLASATLGAAITTWTTFVPSFLWIFLGAPFVERLRGNRPLSTALSSVSAAVVGVILNLALWFGLKLIFPEWARIDVFSLALALMAGWVLIRRKWPVAPVLLGCALAGLVYRLSVG